MRIAIVGYGVAGIAASIFLRRQGHEVTHFEQAENPSPIGAGFLLQPTGLCVLEALGLRGAALARGARIEQIIGGDRRGRPIMNLCYGSLEPNSFGLGIQRGALFHLLRDADTKAGELRAGIKIAGADADQGILFTLRGKRFGPFDLIVGADGAGSFVRHALAAFKTRDWKYPWGAALCLLDDPKSAFARRVIQIFDGERHVSIWPVGSAAAGAPPRVNLSWRIDLTEKDALFATGVEVWKRQVESIFPLIGALLRQITEPTQVHLAEYRDVELSETHRGKVVLIGDAAHSMSPQLGQGASMALLDAQALANALDSHASLEMALKAFEETRREHVHTYQYLSRLATPVFQSDNPVLITFRDHAFHRLGRVPRFKRAMLRTLAGAQVGLRNWTGSASHAVPVPVSRGETEEASVRLRFSSFGGQGELRAHTLTRIRRLSVSSRETMASSYAQSTEECADNPNSVASSTISRPRRGFCDRYLLAGTRLDSLLFHRVVRGVGRGFIIHSQECRAGRAPAR